MRKEIFHSNRLLFCTWEEADFTLAQQLWQNKTVSKYLTTSEGFSNEEIKNRLVSEITSFKKFGIQYWPIFTRDNHTFIGCAGLRPHDNSTLEIGFHLLPEFWGKGYGTEAAKAIINYSATFQNITHLFAGHHPENIPSKQLLLKLGFLFRDTSFYAPTNLYHPSYIFKLKK